MNVIVAAALGIALGAVTGMPLGVVNVAIVDAASAGQVRRARAIGAGGGLADAIHAGLAFVGVGRVITTHRTWLRAMAIAAAIAIVGYAAVAWRARRRPAPSDRGRAGVLAGLALTLPNPAALGAWVAVAAALWPTIPPGDALVLAAGVGIGSATWFALLAGWVARAPADHVALRAIPRVALVLLVVFAAAGVARAFA